METKNQRITASVQYERPEIEVLDVVTEGAFCVSMQQLTSDEEYEYAW